jgi:hypothetical protein
MQQVYRRMIIMWKRFMAVSRHASTERRWNDLLDRCSKLLEIKIRFILVRILRLMYLDFYLFFFRVLVVDTPLLRLYGEHVLQVAGKHLPDLRAPDLHHVGVPARSCQLDL